MSAIVSVDERIGTGQPAPPAVVSGEATPADVDVLNIESLGIAVNPAAAEAQGVTIPEDLLSRAEVVD